MTNSANSLSPEPGARFGVVEELWWWAGAVRTVGSPLYAELFARMSEDAERGGPTAAVFAGLDQLDRDAAIPLRAAGRVHRIVLEGRAPELARHYPSVGGRVRGEETWNAFRTVLAEHVDEIRAALDFPPQTNEVGRCAALIGGFLEVARRWGLPLRVLEVGASAGLNLRWDHYRYEARGATWGPDSPVRLCGFNTQRLPPFHVSPRVIERGGCDVSPIDISTHDGRLSLLSFVWPDQVHRIRLVKAAFEVARRVPVTIDREDLAVWTARALERPRPGVAIVVFHSIVMQYLLAATREQFASTLDDAGARASPEAPLAHLRMEPAGDMADVVLTTWPEGETRRVARAGYHGDPVEWLGD